MSDVINVNDGTDGSGGVIVNPETPVVPTTGGGDGKDSAKDVIIDSNTTADPSL